MFSKCLLGILLLSCPARCVDEVDKECEVKERLEYKLDSPVTFKALARPNTTFEAEVSCKNDLLHHLLTFDSNSTKLSRSNYQGVLSSEILPSPGFYEGWTHFKLAVEHDGYDFVDSAGRSWIPKGVSSECQAEKVTLSKGHLMDSCGDGTPTWKVSGGNCVEIPVLKTDLRWFTLYSGTHFSPTFDVRGIEFELGWKDGNLKLVSDTKLPLAPHRRYCFSLSDSSDGNVKLQALQEDDSPLVVFLVPADLKVSVCDRLFGGFKIQQSSEKCGGISRETDRGNSLPVTGIVVGTVGAVTMKFICCWYFLKRRRNNQATREERRTGDSPKEERMPVYLEPIPYTRSTPPNNRGSSASSSNTSDHIYEEIDESTVYVNCPGTCEAEPHLDDEYEGIDSEISDE